MSHHRYVSGQGYVSWPQPKRNRLKRPFITREEFGEGAGRALRQPGSAARRISEVCRLARIYRRLTPREIAETVGCALSHVYELERGGIAQLESYVPFITAVKLDRAALLRFVLNEAPPPTAVQAESLLLLQEIAPP